MLARDSCTANPWPPSKNAEVSNAASNPTAVYSRRQLGRTQSAEHNNWHIQGRRKGSIYKEASSAAAIQPHPGAAGSKALF